MPFANGLRTARRRKGMTQAELGRLIGVANSTISGYENGTSEAGEEKIIAIMKVLEVDANALFEWEPEHLTQEEQRIGRAYGLADPQVRRTVKVALEPWLDKLQTKTPAGTDSELSSELLPLRMRPLSNLPASAGTGVFLDENNYTQVPIGPDVPDRAGFGVRISGSSMEPDYPDGHIAWIETAVDLRAGDVGLFVYDGAGYIKALGDGELISLNPDYPPIKIREGLRLDVSGRVVAVTEDVYR